MTELRPGPLQEIHPHAEGVAIVFDDMTIILSLGQWAAILHYLEG